MLRGRSGPHSCGSTLSWGTSTPSCQEDGGLLGLIWERGDRAASRPQDPWPHCSARSILRRGPLFGRAGLRGKISLSELGNILF